MFYIIVGSITIIAFILLIFAIYYNKFQFIIIKIDEAEENADILLKKKKELIERCIPIIKDELKLKEFIPEINDINEEMNHFEMNEKLTECYHKLFQKLDDNEVDLAASVKFYNDSVVDFNKLILSFPSNIIRLFFGYKKKEFYSHEKREMFEILKEDK